MDHPTIEQLFAHLDGALDPDPAAAVALHLRDCAACRRELETLRRIERSARSALVERLESASIGAILDAAMPAQPKRRRMPRFELTGGNIVFGLFLSVTAVFSVFVFLRSTPREQSESATTRLQETVTSLDQSLSDVVFQIKRFFEPLRAQSSEEAASTIMLVLPVLVLLFLVDWYYARFVRKREQG